MKILHHVALTFVRRFTLKDVRNWNNLPTKTYSGLGVCVMSNMDVLGSKTPSLAINVCVFVCVCERLQELSAVKRQACHFTRTPHKSVFKWDHSSVSLTCFDGSSTNTFLERERERHRVTFCNVLVSGLNSLRGQTEKTPDVCVSKIAALISGLILHIMV